MNNSPGETILNSTPVLKRLMKHAERWGNTHTKLVKSHENFFELEKVEKKTKNSSEYSEANVDAYYCQPPCQNAEEYAVSHYFSRQTR